jgi:5'(3')-deoxyribonucleotidase
MRLGIDLDGVVADFILGWMTRYNLEFGGKLTEDLVDHWDAAGDLTHFETLADFWDWAGATGGGPTVFRHLSTYPGAMPTLCELATEHDIVILSMKPDWAASDTFAWIAEQHLPTREIHLIRDKWKVDCDIYLDDSPFAIPALVEHRPESIVCRFVRPWNQPVAGAHDIYSWEEFCAFVRKEACQWSRTA